MQLVLLIIWTAVFFIILGPIVDNYQRNISCYPKISFDEFLTLYNAYKEKGNYINLYSCEADIDFGRNKSYFGDSEHLYLSTWKDRIKFYKWRKIREKQLRNKKKEQILAEIRKEVGSSPDVPADVYEAIMNDLKKKYRVK